MSSYVICATPRSGSTLLCALLRASGVAGWPETWFRQQDMAASRAEWGIGPDWAAYLAAALQAGRGHSGVVGLRMMWQTFTEVGPQVVAAMQAPRFIWLRRGDLVAQAVSRHRAEVSGNWQLGFEEAEHPVEPVYGFDRIAHWLAEAQADDRAWADWFPAEGIAPLQLRYEDLAADPVAAAQSVLNWLGLVAERPLVVSNRRMADRASTDWATRFRLQAG